VIPTTATAIEALLLLLLPQQQAPTATAGVIPAKQASTAIPTPRFLLLPEQRIAMNRFYRLYRILLPRR
jgi:hypothetical protein